MLYNAILTTLAVGEKYAIWAAAFLREFVRAGNAALVVTDQPEAFLGIDLTIIPYAPEAGSIWHAKRYAIRAGLERAWTAYFLDADHQIRVGWEDRLPLLRRLPVGANAFFHLRPLLEIEFNYADGLTIMAQAQQLDLVAAHLGVGDWRSALWWGDWLFAVTRDEEDIAWRKFIETWDRFAQWSANKNGCPELAFGDGIAMAFSALACGWRPTTQTPAFAPIVLACHHTMSGDWKQKFIEQENRRRDAKALQ
jgi:hypothetical protein